MVYQKLVQNNLKKYRDYIEKHANDPDAGLDNMDGPGSKKGGKCGAADALQKAIN